MTRTILRRAGCVFSPFLGLPLAGLALCIRLAALARGVRAAP